MKNFKYKKLSWEPLRKRHGIADLPTDKDESFNPCGVRLVYCRL